MSAFKDIQGQIIQGWKAVSPTEKRTTSGGVIWRVECSCGTQIEKSAHTFRSLKTPCVCARIGKTYGNLTVTSVERGAKGKHHYFHCTCSCGEHVRIRSTLLERQGQCKYCALKGVHVINLLGVEFGEWIVVQRFDRTDSSRNTYWLCVSRDTGSTKELAGAKIRGRGYQREMAAMRYAAKFNRVPKWADRDAMRQIYQDTPAGCHVDHIVPLKGTNVSGLHVHENLQYLQVKENIRKGNRFAPEITSKSN